jgi:hypothetical protein
LKKNILVITLFSCCLQFSYGQIDETDSSYSINTANTESPETVSPSTLPDVKYHLTARPWQALNISKDDYLIKVEETAREIVKFQNAEGAIIDPYANLEIQYSTPYFANAVGTLLSAGRAADLLEKGIAAMNSATADIAGGASAIPNGHGEFFLAPLSAAISLYAPYVSDIQLKSWKNRMAKPIADIIRGSPHNWRTYAMKGEWNLAKNGYINKDTAISWLENSWNKTQKKRITNNSFNFYHDGSGDPDTWAYESVARSNLAAMIAEGYDGPSTNEISDLLKKGTQYSLLLQDPTGQAAAGGRSGNHTWNDILLASGYETMAEIVNREGNTQLAGQYRRAAALSFRSIERWRRSDGTYSVTKNHFNPEDRIRYANYSFFANYNGNIMYHMAENYLRHQTNIPEQPAPNEIGGYTIVSDPALATAAANAGGMHMEVSLRGSAGINHELYWTTLGAVRFARTGWDSRLGPSDGVRETVSKLGVSFAPTFLEKGTWVRLASMPERYEVFFSTQFTHPLLVRCRVEYKPKQGQTGPSFTNDFIITPDGILSTVTSAADNYGITWPVLTFDGTTSLNTSLSSYIASTSFPGETDQQNFIALHSSPAISAPDEVRRSSYGDLRPVRMVSGTDRNITFIYPRNAEDPLAEDVRKSYTRSGNDFSTVLARVKGDTYAGRTSAGGVGKSIDINNDDSADAVFNISTGFVMQLENGKIIKIETDRDVTAVIHGQTINIEAYSPAIINNTVSLNISKVIARSDDGNVPVNTIDKDYNTRWSGRGDNQWIRFYLDKPATISSVSIAWYRGDKRQASFDIQTSLDSTDWTTVFSGQSSGQTTTLETYNVFPTFAQYIRIVGHSNNLNAWNAITEVEFLKDTASSKNQLKALKGGSRKEQAELKMMGEPDHLRVWPNPSKGIFTIQTSPLWSDAKLMIYDLSGKIVLNRSLNQIATQINLSKEARGTYLLQLTKDDKIVNRKITLQ